MDSSDIIESNLSFGEMKYRENTIMAVYHAADWSKCTVQEIHEDHKNKGYAGIGYHFFVAKDGSIWRGRHEGAVGSHCLGSNSYSIGICAEGDYMTEEMPEVQKQSLIELGIYLKEKYGFKQIYGHRELYATDCPGTNYPLDEIRNAVLNKKEVKKLKNIVVYSGEGDKPAAELLAYFLQCPIIAFNCAQNVPNEADNIYIVGGVKTLSTGNTLISSIDRYKTTRKVLDFIEGKSI